MKGDTMLETRTAPSVKPAPVETVTPIKPSEAIRLGCLIAPVQAFGWYGSRRTGEACAIGAMNIGYGDRTNRSSPVSRRGGPSIMTCPECGESSESTVSELNDDHGWSRERIADWLEGLDL